MTYNEFLFYSLIKDTANTHPLKEMEYDSAFDVLGSYYSEFFDSQDHSIGEYEAIIKFLNTNYNHNVTLSKV